MGKWAHLPIPRKLDMEWADKSGIQKCKEAQASIFSLLHLQCMQFHTLIEQYRQRTYCRQIARLALSLCSMIAAQ
jgi:hypothetical protein